MGRLIFTIMAAMVCVVNVASADDTPITTKQLPEQAQHFLNDNFKGEQVLLATLDKDLFDSEYEVVLADGTKIEFDGNGRWESVSVRGRAVLPQLVPARIAEFVKQNYPDAFIYKIQRDRRGYEVALSNKLELKFDSALRLVEIDD